MGAFAGRISVVPKFPAEGMHHRQFTYNPVLQALRFDWRKIHLSDKADSSSKWKVSHRKSVNSRAYLDTNPYF
jgi:hypothetical protein